MAALTKNKYRDQKVVFFAYYISETVRFRQILSIAEVILIVRPKNVPRYKYCQTTPCKSYSVSDSGSWDPLVCSYNIMFTSRIFWNLCLKLTTLLVSNLVQLFQLGTEVVLVALRKPSLVSLYTWVGPSSTLQSSISGIIFYHLYESVSRIFSRTWSKYLCIERPVSTNKKL